MEDKILEFLKASDEPVKPGDIADACNLDRKDVDKAIKKLKTEDKIFSPKRCFYSAK